MPFNSILSKNEKVSLWKKFALLSSTVCMHAKKHCMNFCTILLGPLKLFLFLFLHIYNKLSVLYSSLPKSTFCMSFPATADYTLQDQI